MEEIIEIVTKRYIDILEKNIDVGYGKYSSKHLIEMLKTLNENKKEWSIDKTNRWLGFIQGVMTVYQLIDVDEEREFTRPLFHKYYKENNLAIPQTLNLEK